MHRPALTVAVLLLTFAARPLDAAVPAAGALQVTVSEQQLSVTGVTPGAQLALFGISTRNVGGMLARQDVAKILADSDRDGAVAYEAPLRIPVRSVWIAADLATGAFAVAAPMRFEVEHHEIDLNDLKRDSDGLAAALELKRLRADLLLVRPGEGAWLLQAYQGGGGDGDGAQDGLLTLLFEHARPLEAGSDQKAPKRLRKGDVLAVIDPGTLEVRTLTVGR